MSIVELPDNCCAHILSFIDNVSFGATRCTAKCFHISSVTEILIRKIILYVDVLKIWNQIQEDPMPIHHIEDGSILRSISTEK